MMESDEEEEHRDRESDSAGDAADGCRGRLRRPHYYFYLSVRCGSIKGDGADISTCI